MHPESDLNGQAFYLNDDKPEDGLESNQEAIEPEEPELELPDEDSDPTDQSDSDASTSDEDDSEKDE